MSDLLGPAELSALRHDLRTPVNHIVGYCELLLDDASTDEQRGALHAAIAAARDVLGVIDGGLPADGTGVSRASVDALRNRLRPSHDRILAAMDALGGGPGFAADVAKVRRATGQLLALDRAATIQPAAAPASPAQPAPPTLAKGRILVVDDVEDNRAVLLRHLERQGFTADEARDGETALALARRTGYDLMLLDIRMPGIDGLEVLTRIKHDPALRDLPVVMISAADELETIAGCIEAGADDFLPKPFDPVILRARVSASVEKKRLRDLEVDYLRQVDRVVQAATAVDRGTYAPGTLAEVGRRDDAIGHLARVFDAMAAGVRAREERLSAQVHTLRQEIDAARRGGGGSPDPVAEGDMLLPGTIFAGRYAIIRVVGRGGMGMVYKAHDRELDEDVAIKLLRPDVLRGDPTMVERFKSEIRLARRISHTNVVRTHDFGERDGTYYVTMEYVEGITVRELIGLRRRLSTEATLGIARQLAGSLIAAHEQGVVHRDLKPENLLLDAAGALKVMDWGIAKLADHASTITQAGMVVGTPAYMAPEQLLAETVDARSDLYSTGVVLYESLTGALPHEGANPLALIARVLNQVPVPPHDRSADVPAPLSALVMQLLAKDPAARPQTAAELAELLAQIE